HRIPSLLQQARYTVEIKKNGNNIPGKFIQFLRVVFKQPRQTLFNNLRKSGLSPSDKLDVAFKELGLDKKIRPQNLNQQQLIKLFSFFNF
ncbi:MAG: hypothetical protein WAP55_00915, partial [Minisyncoccia bacterium]